MFLRVQSMFVLCLLLVSSGCGGGGGTSGGSSAQDPPASQPTTPPPAAPTVSFSASPTTVDAGQPTTLTWATTNATTVSIQGVGSVGLNGSKAVAPTSNTTYTMTATGLGGTAQANVKITVNTAPNAPRVSIQATPGNIYVGQTSTLTWASKNATTVSISGLGSVALSGSMQVTPGATETYVATANGKGGADQASATVNVSIPGSISHVIVLYQENRSADNMFHDPNLIAAGADIASSGLSSDGQMIPLVPRPLADTYNPYHDHPDFVVMYDGGKMDGANLIQIQCPNGPGTCTPPPYPQYVYVQASDLGPYFQMAETYTFADRMFQTNQGDSYPAHQFIFSATSAPTETSDLFVSGNPSTPDGTAITGCMAPAAETVPLIDPSGNQSFMYPCFEHSTLSDLLDQKGISWRYYTDGLGDIWTAPNSIDHICQPSQPTGGKCTGAGWLANVVQGPATVLTDISNGNLAAVTWVMPPGLSSDHPGTNDGSGPSWIASIVNAIGNSPYWASTAIFITWDDWGGFYDHVPPQIINSYEYGFRVPLILISPYAKRGYISHVTHDFGSILHFIENTYGLPSLGFADALADDFSDCFNFDQSPSVFQTIPADKAPEFFIHDKRPSVPLDND
jgi:phospholipase C